MPLARFALQGRKSLALGALILYITVTTATSSHGTPVLTEFAMSSHNQVLDGTTGQRADWVL